MTFKTLIFENFGGPEVSGSKLYQKNIGAKLTCPPYYARLVWKMLALRIKGLLSWVLHSQIQLFLISMIEKDEDNMKKFEVNNLT